MNIQSSEEFATSCQEYRQLQNRNLILFNFAYSELSDFDDLFSECSVVQIEC